MNTSNIKPLNLSLVVQKALILARTALPANIEILQNLPETIPAINADETQIHQVIHNLCSNAHDAIGESGGILEFTLELDKDSPDSIGGLNGSYCLKLTVKDSGQGIKRENQDKIFDPFFTTKHAGKGSGLGLSVVHGIMTSHKGTITVESQIGKGTTFTLFFPTTEDKVQETQLQYPASNDGHGHGNILIAEDEPELANLYKSYLEDQGYAVTLSANGFDALRKFKENPNQFDVVVTDHFMPKMTGKQLVPKLLEIRSDIPIIFTTGYSELMPEQESRALKVHLYLVKPLSLTLLKDAIDVCIKSL
jgi:two-component system cell cycle sensor histidine kinase/response regulator CckA